MSKPFTTPNRRSAIIVALIAVALTHIFIEYLMLAFLFSNDPFGPARGVPQQLQTVVSIALWFIVPVSLAIPTYTWLRKNRIGKKSEVTTALIVAAGAVTSNVIAPLISGSLSAVQFMSIWLVVGMYLFNAVIAFLFAVLGAHIAKKYYTRRHGIVTD